MKFDTDTIKRLASCTELLTAHGIGIDSRGKCRCAFHDDAHASMQVYADGYHCFACGAHGDVIDLARQFYGVSFSDALQILAEMYGIAPESNGDWKQKREEQERRRTERQQRIEQARNNYFRQVALFRLCETLRDSLAPTEPTETVNPIWAAAVREYGEITERMRQAEAELVMAERNAG